MCSKLVLSFSLLVGLSLQGCSYISASGDWPSESQTVASRSTHYERRSQTSAARAQVANQAIIPPPAGALPSYVGPISQPSAGRSTGDNTVDYLGQDIVSAPATSAPAPSFGEFAVEPRIVGAPTAVAAGTDIAGPSAEMGLPPARTSMVNTEIENSTTEVSREFEPESPKEEAKKVSSKPRQSHNVASDSLIGIKRTPRQAADDSDRQYAKSESSKALEQPEVATLKEELKSEESTTSTAARESDFGMIEDVEPTVSAVEQTTTEVSGVSNSELAALEPSAVAPLDQSAECGKADEEAKRARDAVSDADRLFYYRRALRLCPSQSKYHLEIGKIYAGLGRIEDAEQEFRQVLVTDPDNVDAKAKLAELSQSR